MKACRCCLRFLILLTLIAGKHLQAAPLPFLPYDQADSADALLRLAESEVQPWIGELQSIRSYDKEDQAYDALTGYEQLIRHYAGDAGALERLVPLYWRQTTLTDETNRRQNLFHELAEQSSHLMLLALTEDLLQRHAQWHLSRSEQPDEDAHDDQETLLQVKTGYDQLLLYIESSEGQEPDIFLQTWLSALLRFYAPSGGFRTANTYLLNQSEPTVPPALITIYRKILHDLAGQSTTSRQQGSWLLPGAGAEMTTGEMGKQAKWAFGRFTGKASSTISSAWRSMEISITCFHQAQHNPQVFRFHLCLMPLDAARQNINTLYDLLYVGHNAKRRAPWRDMWEWNAGDLEYEQLVDEFNLIVRLKHRVETHLQDGLQQQIAQTRNIQDPEEQIQANLNLLDNPLADIISPQQKQAARNQLNANLAAILGQKARNAAALRFNEQQNALLDQLKREPLNEAVWDQYLQLLNSEDAKVSLDSSVQLQQIASVEQQKQQATIRNHSNRLLETFKQAESHLKQQYPNNPIQTLQDYLILLDSEAGRSLSDHDSLVTQTLKDLQARQEKSERFRADKIPLFTALESLGRGEDPLSQSIEHTTDSLIKISYEHFPQETEQVLGALSHIDSVIDAVVEFIDDKTGNTASAVWQQLDESTQSRILGAGKVLSVLVPVAKVKAQAELGKSARSPVGRTGQKHDFINLDTPKPRNAPEIIQGRDYSGHAIDRMQERGITPTIVDNAIKKGIKSIGNQPDTLIFFGQS
ncbi:hypothetical protein ACH42_00335 [Endozoicomonas sp. (ex Bugula neritina AB1)]|nr:hypothetical protein ACH42_00335 [Endozoicomonas sp. (ex Bugula neritina AB1)]